MRVDTTCRYRDCSTNLDGVAHVAAGSEEYTGDNPDVLFNTSGEWIGGIQAYAATGAPINNLQEAPSTLIGTVTTTQNAEDKEGKFTIPVPEAGCASDPDGGCLGDANLRRMGAEAANNVVPGSRLPNGDVAASSMAQQLFQRNRQTWNAASTVANPKFYVYWTVAATITGAVGPYAPKVAQTLYYSPAFWDNASYFIEGLTPGPAPAAYATAAGEIVSYYWDEIW